MRVEDTELLAVSSVVEERIHIKGCKVCRQQKLTINDDFLDGAVGHGGGTEADVADSFRVRGVVPHIYYALHFQSGVVQRAGIGHTVVGERSRVTHVAPLSTLCLGDCCGTDTRTTQHYDCSMCTLFLTHTHTHSHPQHTHIHTHSLTYMLSLTHTLSLIHTNIFTHPHIYSYTLSHTNPLTHMYKPTHSHTYIIYSVKGCAGWSCHTNLKLFFSIKQN